MSKINLNQLDHTYYGLVIVVDDNNKKEVYFETNYLLDGLISLNRENIEQLKEFSISFTQLFGHNFAVVFLSKQKLDDKSTQENLKILNSNIPENSKIACLADENYFKSVKSKYFKNYELIACN